MPSRKASKGRFHDEHWFLELAIAWLIIEACLRDYKGLRRRVACGDATTAEFTSIVADATKQVLQNAELLSPWIHTSGRISERERAVSLTEGQKSLRSGPSPRLPLPRYRELGLSDINCDLQIHTTWTDGTATAQDLLEAALDRGLKRVAFTEHVRRESNWFPNFAKEIRDLRVSWPDIEVLVGCEAKALDTHGSLDATDEILAECQIVLGSVHRLPMRDGQFAAPGSLPLDELLRIELSASLGLIDIAPIDVLAHPMGMTLRKHKHFPVNAMREMLERASEQGVAVEINASYLGPDLERFLSLCNEINPYVSIGSDVHKLEQLGECRDRLIVFRVGEA